MYIPFITGKRKPMAFWKQMVIGMIAGIAAGLVASDHGLGLVPREFLSDVTDWIMLPANAFLALITMIVMPLVFSSVMLAITSSGGMDFLKTVGLRVAGYFVATTTVAVLIGIALSKLINPAQFVPQDWVENVSEGITLSSVTSQLTDGASIPSLLVDLIPTNPAQVVMEQQMLQLVIAAIIIGLAVLALRKSHATPVIDLMVSVQEICMKIVHWAMVIAPIAVFGFLFRLTVETGPDMLQALSAYIFTVLLGLALILCMYLVIVATLARRNPMEFLRNIRNAQVLAFSSSSSAATMPVSLEVAETKLNVKPEIARLVVPLGTTINMDGTAFYQVVVALFLTQIMGIDLSTGQMILMSITIIGASIGSPGSPGVGLVILATILTNIGVPPEAIGIILSVDRFLDMCRTTVNVTGDLTATVVMDRLAQGKKWAILDH